MKKTINVLFIIGITVIFSLFESYKSFSVVTENKIKLADSTNSQLCPGVSNCCESGYNVMCHMVDPIKNYNVSDVVCGNRGGGVYHKGMDLTKGSGDGTIYASFQGKVIATTNNSKNCAPGGSLQCSPITCSSSRGISVTIEVTDPLFAGYTIHYMHMSSLNVKVGEEVYQGQSLGKIGNTGCSTGTHLHFQINNYAGDPIYITPYFTDKSSYICGGVVESAPNKPIVTLTGLQSLLQSGSGQSYKAQIGNCVGAVNSIFNQGIELSKKITSDIVYVYALEGGQVINQTTSECKNGITIFTENGESHSYCNLKDNSVLYKDNDIISAGSRIGTMDDKFIFIVNRNTKFVDLSSHFLALYGGKCQNTYRTSCNSVRNSDESYQCNNVVIK